MPIKPIAISFVLILTTLLCGQSQPKDALFSGIDDPLVLPLLKSLQGVSGRWNVPPEDGRFLYELVIKRGYKRGLEIGTSNGYSSLWLGLAFRKNGGNLITIEIDPTRAREARENFRKAGLEQVIDSRLNDAFQEIPRVDGEFDFVFIDAWKRDYKRYLDLLYPRVKAGGAITAHNVIDLGGDMPEFLEAIRKDPGLETTIEKTSSTGISVSIKKK